MHHKSEVPLGIAFAGRCVACVGGTELRRPGQGKQIVVEAAWCVVGRFSRMAVLGQRCDGDDTTHGQTCQGRDSLTISGHGGYYRSAESEKAGTPLHSYKWNR